MLCFSSREEQSKRCLEKGGSFALKCVRIYKVFDSEFRGRYGPKWTGYHQRTRHSLKQILSCPVQSLMSLAHHALTHTSKWVQLMGSPIRSTRLQVGVQKLLKICLWVRDALKGEGLLHWSACVYIRFLIQSLEAVTVPNGRDITWEDKTFT